MITFFLSFKLCWVHFRVVLNYLNKITLLTNMQIFLVEWSLSLCFFLSFIPCWVQVGTQLLENFVPKLKKKKKLCFPKNLVKDEFLLIEIMVWFHYLDQFWRWKRWYNKEKMKIKVFSEIFYISNKDGKWKSFFFFGGVMVLGKIYLSWKGSILQIRYKVGRKIGAVSLFNRHKTASFC